MSGPRYDLVPRIGEALDPPPAPPVSPAMAQQLAEVQEALKQERDKGEGLARDLAAVRREMETLATVALKKAFDETAMSGPRYDLGPHVGTPPVPPPPAPPPEPRVYRNMYEEMMATQAKPMTNRQAAEAYEASLPDPPPLTDEVHRQLKAIRWKTHCSFFGCAVAGLLLSSHLLVGTLFFWAIYAWRNR